jgi:hypothetical protein
MGQRVVGEQHNKEPGKRRLPVLLLEILIQWTWVEPKPGFQTGQHAGKLYRLLLVIPATWEAEVGGSWSKATPDKKETLSKKSLEQKGLN